MRALLLVVVCAFLTGCGGLFVGVDPGTERRSPLEKAAQEGDLAGVQRLLASGADANERSGIFGAPLNAAAARSHNVEVVRALLRAGANPNGRGQEGNRCWVSPLAHAAWSGDLESMRALLESGATIPSSGCSKLVAAWLKPRAIDLLRGHGLDLFATDERGRNQLHLAMAPPAVPEVDTIEYLIQAGVSLQARDAAGKTPLAYWREPRYFETHWFRAWLVERLSGDTNEFQRERDKRAKISALLERSGAAL